MTSPNALGLALGIFGDEWTLLLLRTAAVTGAARYTEFAKALPISNAVLTNRLDRMVDADLMAKHTYRQKPPRSEYRLTARGLAARTILIGIWGWEKAWVPTHRFDTPAMIHAVCGKETHPVFCCGHCQKPATARDVMGTWGPNAGWERSIPASTTRRRSSSRTNPRASQTTADLYPDTMSIFGNRWSAAVVGAAFAGIRRFKDFESALHIPPSLLSERLSALCDFGILKRTGLSRRPDWSEYRLTPKGLDFFPIIAVVLQWAQHWLGTSSEPILVWTHKACGHTFNGVFTCGECGGTLSSDNIRTAANPT